jgi:class 3 adenylate cyclase/tetratricopeptide (TPR) repeat protein
MHCAQCQSDNLDDAVFCQACGNRLQRQCPACKTINSADSRFCRMCGTRLEAGAEHARRGPPADDGPRAAIGANDPLVPAQLAQRYREALAEQLTASNGERKIITALFADIKGSMSLLDQLDPEQAQRLIDPALRLMIDAVYRFEGFVAQTLGDGIFALFGAPIAREDHARCAVHAALAMQERLKAQGARLLAEQGLPPLQLRVGINTGEVVVRSIATDANRADYVPVGNSIGLAARIEGLAAPGSVVVSESTQRLTEGYFDFRALGTVPIKGMGAGAKLYEVAGVGPLRTRLEVSARRGLAQFVGRHRELTQLRGLLAETQAGRGQIAEVVGEAGVGKSRLCHEFLAHAERDCVVMACALQSYGRALAFLPLIDMLKGYFHVAPADDDRLVTEKVLASLHALGREQEDSAPFLLRLLGVAHADARAGMVDPQVRRQRTWDALKSLFLRVSADKPVLIMIEDLHWIDEETKGFLLSFAQDVPAARIMLLVNYRPELQALWDDTAAHHTLRLQTLDAADARSLLQTLLGNAPSLAELGQLIVEKTQGNPFFIEEYVQTLFDQGVLARTPDIRLLRPVASIQMPATVQGVIAARIDRLPSQDKSFLQLLSVLGSAAPLGLIERVTPEPADEVQQQLDRLAASEFVYVRAQFPDVEYAFKHALTRETAYAGLLAETKQTLHALAAAATEAHYADRLGDHYGDLAHHYAASGNALKAVEYLRRAARKAMERSGYSEAIDCLSEALQLLPRLSDAGWRDTQELQIQAMLGAAWSATRGFAAQEAAAAFERARSLCAENTASSDLIRVLPGLGLLKLNRGELRQARELAEELLGIAERRGDTELAVCAHDLLGLVLLRRGELAASRIHLDKAVSLYRREHEASLRAGLGRDPAVTCLGFGAMALWLLGYPDQALAAAAQAVGLAHRTRHPFSLAYALLSSIWVHQVRGEVRATLHEAQAAAAFANEQGFPSWQAHALVLTGWAQAEQGLTHEGLANIEQALHTYEITGAKIWLPQFLLWQAQALERAGRRKLALERLDRALGYAHEIGPYWWAAELFRVKGEMLAAQDAGQEAWRCFERALLIARSQSARSFELRACISHVRHARDAAEAQTAKRELAEVQRWFTEGHDTPDLRLARKLLGA